MKSVETRIPAPAYRTIARTLITRRHTGSISTSISSEIHCTTRSSCRRGHSSREGNRGSSASEPTATLATRLTVTSASSPAAAAPPLVRSGRWVLLSLGNLLFPQLLGCRA
ncbi:hypothetical protein E2C01_012338 [Portunus trituberculatus]|uniref:Uncharacterized protein n=1 Tax=Portunus trituberculatus TaxID=210409 RepID=A0A5B7DDU0_PORTR|nr:hypothetical protein [Portunus trituberculatus]